MKKIGMLMGAIALLAMMIPAVALGAPRPGDAQPEPAKTITITTAARYQFASPLSEATAHFTNPEDSGSSIVYTLQITIAELLRMAGTTGYSDEAYQALTQQEGFSPETETVILCQTEPIAPGGVVETITLGLLPNGEALPVGEYQGMLVISILTDGDGAQEQITRQPGEEITITPSMTVSARMSIPISIEEDTITLFADEQGVCAMRIYNQADSVSSAVYSIQLSQAEIETVTGQSHQPDQVLLAQRGEASFNAEYVFISVFESGPVAPGEFLKSAELAPLPDGQPLPSGTYSAWLVKYLVDGTGNQDMQPVNIAITLVIP